jgi:hypothetical protein
MKKKSTHLANKGHDTSVMSPDPKFNLEVFNNTITLSQAEEMSAVEIHEAVGMTLAKGIGTSVSFKNLMTSVARRINEGESVGGCDTLKEYTETYVKLPTQSSEAAIRRVYRAIAKCEKDPRRTGRPKSPSRKQLIKALDTAQRAAAQGPTHTMPAVPPAKPVEINAPNPVAAATEKKFDEAVQIIRGIIFAVGKPAEKKARKAAVNFLKVHNAFGVEPPLVKKEKSKLGDCSTCGKGTPATETLGTESYCADCATQIRRETQVSSNRRAGAKKAAATKRSKREAQVETTKGGCTYLTSDGIVDPETQSEGTKTCPNKHFKNGACRKHQFLTEQVMNPEPKSPTKKPVKAKTDENPFIDLGLFAPKRRRRQPDPPIETAESFEEEPKPSGAAALTAKLVEETETLQKSLEVQS